MKQTRRKELKTNELSLYLQQIYEAMQRHSSYLIGGLVVVVLVLVVGLYVQHNRHKTLQDAWNNYYDLSGKDVVTQPDALDKARALAAEYADHRDLGPVVLQLRGDLAYPLAMSLNGEKDRDRRLELLREAKSSYEQMLQNFSDRPEVGARARMSLAGVEETLVALGQSKPEQVREYYQKLVDTKPNAFAELAAKKLIDLDKHLEPLKIVATRPAPPPTTAPSTTPAADTLPAEAPPATMPAPIAPISPTTRPAATQPMTIRIPAPASAPTP